VIYSEAFILLVKTFVHIQYSLQAWGSIQYSTTSSSYLYISSPVWLDPITARKQHTTNQVRAVIMQTSNTNLPFTSAEEFSSRWFKIVMQLWKWSTYYEFGLYHFNSPLFKVVRHIEMPKAAPKKSICHFQKLDMILKWNKQNTVRLPQKYQFLLIKFVKKNYWCLTYKTLRLPSLVHGVWYG